MKLLVSGSRDFKDDFLVCTQLNYFKSLITFDNISNNELIIIEGGCPTGVDKFAADWAEKLIYFLSVISDDGLIRLGVPRIKHERYPADWKTFGRAAGPKRNKLMVEQRPDHALFIINKPLKESRGTYNCYAEAKAASIPFTLIQTSY